MRKLRNRVAPWTVLLAVAFPLMSRDRCVAGDSGQASPFRVSAKSGPWSSSDTWVDGKVPGPFSRVRIAEGHTVTYDVDSDRVIRTIHVAGTLSFARDRNTRLDVGLIRIQSGHDAGEDGFDCDHPVQATDPHKPRPSLEVGTRDKPLDARYTALIRLVYIDGRNKETLPAIVCCGGRWDMHGAALSRTWVELGANANKGTTQVALAEPATGWKAGDLVLVTGSRNKLHHVDGKLGDEEAGLQTERRRIVKIDGTTVTLDRPLAYFHPGTGEFRCEVANLSRNVVVESANLEMRGHTMYHKHSAGSLAYAEFRHLGKRDLLGKYAIHFHMCGDTMRGSSVQGCSVWDSHNRWITIHGTDHMLVRDCVGYKSIGHGFFLEDGTEQYNLLDRNLAVQAFAGKPLPKQNLPFDKNEGAGFWFANARNSFTRNVSCENQRYGFFFEITARRGFDTSLPLRMPDGSIEKHDVRRIPLFRFEDNEAHSTGIAGVVIGEESNRIKGDKRHPFVVRKLRVWHATYAFRPSADYFLAEDVKSFYTSYGIKAPSLDHQVFRNITLTGSSATIIGSRSYKLPAPTTAVVRSTFENVNIVDSPGNMGFPATPNIPIEVHFKNLTVKNSGPRGILGYNLGTKLPHEASYFFHDYPKSGSVSLVAHLDLAAKDPAKDFQKASFLRDEKLRAAEVKNVAFPTDVLTPVDDLAPATVVASLERRGNKLLVRGVTHDNGVLRAVRVNGVESKLVLAQTGLGDWEALVDVPGNGWLSVQAEDQAGNVESPGHRVRID